MSPSMMRLCKTCGSEKPTTEFYIKRKNPLTYYGDCRTCKIEKSAAARKKRCEAESDPEHRRSDFVGNTIIEPEKMPVTRGNAIIEPSICNDIMDTRDYILAETTGKNFTEPLDFTLWEKLYGRKLSDDEKAEIQANLLAFVTVLVEERNRQTGDYVELSKDQ